MTPSIKLQKVLIQHLCRVAEPQVKAPFQRYILNRPAAKVVFPSLGGTPRKMNFEDALRYYICIRLVSQGVDLSTAFKVCHRLPPFIVADDHLVYAHRGKPWPTGPNADFLEHVQAERAGDLEDIQKRHALIDELSNPVWSNPIHTATVPADKPEYLKKLITDRDNRFVGVLPLAGPLADYFALCTLLEETYAGAA